VVKIGGGVFCQISNVGTVADPSRHERWRRRLVAKIYNSMIELPKTKYAEFDQLFEVKQQTKFCFGTNAWFHRRY
jgi:hypothetical protein